MKVPFRDIDYTTKVKCLERLTSDKPYGMFNRMLTKQVDESIAIYSFIKTLVELDYTDSDIRKTIEKGITNQLLYFQKIMNNNVLIDLIELEPSNISPSYSPGLGITWKHHINNKIYTKDEVLVVRFSEFSNSIINEFELEYSRNNVKHISDYMDDVDEMIKMKNRENKIDSIIE